MSLLQLNQLTVRFGGLTAVSKVDCAVERGEIFSIIGPNGAGKTTIFNAITGVHHPSDGHVLFEGRAVSLPLTLKTAFGFALSGLLTGVGALIVFNVQEVWLKTITAHYTYRKPFPWGEAVGDFFSYFGGLSWGGLLFPFLVGAVIGGGGAYAVWRRARRTPDIIAKHGVVRTFQNIRLFPQMTVLENVLVGMDSRLATRFWHAALRLPLFWREQREAVQRAMEILKFVGLENEARLPASGLAYGHQRRLEIARALATQPSLLLLDEPAAGMNPQECADMMDLIRRIRAQGKTVLLIEHHMQCVMGISDRIAVLDHGEKIAEGTPSEVQKDRKVISAYLGEPDATA